MNAGQKQKSAKILKIRVQIFIVIGAGGMATDMNVLSQLSNRQPVKLRELNFREMFVWLSTSLSSVSHSNPNDEVPLQTPLGWGKV